MSRTDSVVDIVIYHNPECGTSRNALAMIRNAGIEPHVVEYLKTPPARALLVALIDRAGMTLHRGGAEVRLSSTEFRLLLVFLDRPGRVLSRTQLLELVWGDPGWGDDHVVEVTVGRLRAKIGATHLHTVRGLGYKLVRP